MAENEEAGQKDSSFHELWQRLPAHQIDPVRWFLVLVQIIQESKIPRERVSKWNNWRLQSVNSKGYKINLFVNFHFTTHIKYFNNLFSAKPMRRRPWESRSKFGMGSTQSQFSICNSQFSNSILNSQAQFSGTGSTQARQQDRVLSLFWLLASAPVRFPRFISSSASNCFFFSKLNIPFACLESHTTDN